MNIDAIRESLASASLVGFCRTDASRAIAKAGKSKEGKSQIGKVPGAKVGKRSGAKVGKFPPPPACPAA